MVRNSAEHLRWCIRQDLVSVERANEILARDYIRKADEALEVAFSLEEDEYYEWTVTAAYFARYFALTGLLRRCGIVSENHACAITILEEIFVNSSEVESDLLNSIKRGKNSRIEKQYGIVDTDRASATRQREDAIEFVTALRSYLADLTDDKVEKIRKFFKKFLL